MTSNALSDAIVFGESLLQLPIGQEDFLTKVDAYLLLVEAVETLLKSGAIIDRTLIESFMKIHGEIIGMAELEKQEVLHSLGELHRRSSVLRTYIDQVPPRVSITGKREG